MTASLALADWTKISTGYQSTSYADLNSIQVGNTTTVMNALIDYTKAPFDGNNLSYLSLKMKVEYNCTTKQFRTLHLSSYAGHMATGARPYTSDELTDWQAVLPKQTQDELWEVACKKK